MKISTYNIFSGRTPGGAYDLDGKIGVIRAFGAEIVSLNEVHRGTLHSAGRSQADDIADALGMRYRFFARSIWHNGGEYGIALLSRYPFRDARALPIPDAAEKDGSFEPRVIIDAHIDINGKILHVISSHYGLSAPERRLAVETTLKLALTDEPTIMMGDLNTEPSDPIIAPLFGRFNDTAAGREKCTFPSDAPNIRIDYIFASRDIKVVSSGVIDSQCSDHRPAAAEIEL